jgi:hypothetical protein
MNDLQVQFTHPGDDQLAGLLVGETAEGGILFSEPLQALRPTVSRSALVLGSTAIADDRLREGRRFEQHLEALITEGVARGDIA